MTHDPVEITALLHQNLPGCDVTLSDLRGDGQHYALAVSAPAFEGRSRLEQQRMVHTALQDCIDVLDHLTIRTSLPRLIGRNVSGR